MYLEGFKAFAKLCFLTKIIFFFFLHICIFLCISTWSKWTRIFYSGQKYKLVGQSCFEYSASYQSQSCSNSWTDAPELCFTHKGRDLLTQTLEFNYGSTLMRRRLEWRPGNLWLIDDINLILFKTSLRTCLGQYSPLIYLDVFEFWD